MSLDKQRILGELGSVMNQLQNADCGCMGKLFSNQGAMGGSNQGAMGSPLPTCGGCRRGCCHGHGGSGFGAPCAGEPYNMNSCGMNRPCMGGRNPAKMYADTFGYLNQNLMQPVVNEVYNDLKSISPANTIGNNPMAGQMGLSNANPMQNNMGMSSPNMEGGMAGEAVGGSAMGGGAMSAGAMGGGSMGGGAMGAGIMGGGAMGQGNIMSNAGGMPSGNITASDPNQLGAQIVNMMMGGGGAKKTPHFIPPGGHSAHGQEGVTPGMQMNQNQLQSGNMGMPMSQGGYQGSTGSNMYQDQMGTSYMNPTTQYVTQDNMYTSNANGQGDLQNTMNPIAMNSSPQQVGNMNASPAGQIGDMKASPAGQMGMITNPATQMGNMNRNTMGQMRNVNPTAAPTGTNPNYGIHSAGMQKFNEMFPMSGDLGFDPMSIAIQMNPANKQSAVMNTLQQLMDGKGTAQRNAVPTLNSAAANINQPNQLQQNVPVNQITNEQIASQQPNMLVAGQMSQEATKTQLDSQNYQQMANPNAAMVQQQVYTAQTTAPVMNQQALSQQLPMQGQQQMIDPNTGAVINHPTLPGYDGMTGNTNAQPATMALAPPSSNPAQGMIKEPIFPADNSKNFYNYNTLGQPVQMIPARSFHTPVPNLPQTLSPQHTASKMRLNAARYSNVKSTVSKTSLVGNRPIGKTPSRQQLNQIYNQYKGSQSYTQQNIAPNRGITNSAGRINVPQGTPSALQPPPFEKVGGDTIANNAIVNNQVENKTYAMEGQSGDVPIARKPQAQGNAPEQMPIMKNTKLRNGLQDMVYTSYPTSTSWTFHGVNDGPSPTNMYRNRFRSRV